MKFSTHTDIRAAEKIIKMVGLGSPNGGLGSIEQKFSHNIAIKFGKQIQDLSYLHTKKNKLRVRTCPVPQ